MMMSCLDCDEVARVEGHHATCNGATFTRGKYAFIHVDMGRWACQAGMWWGYVTLSHTVMNVISGRGEEWVCTFASFMEAFFF